MVKNKSGREMNPADAFRKQQRQKEILRNKKERQFLRQAAKLRSEPEELKKELTEILKVEDEGKMNLTLRLKRKAVQGAYDTALRAKREAEFKAAGLLPDGSAPAPQALIEGVPLPAPPPLPAGAAPSALNIPVPAASAPLAPLPPPPGPPPRVESGADTSTSEPAAPLPPPPGPPPGLAVGQAPLPPPSAPPPMAGMAVGMMHAPPMLIPLPPPVAPPPGSAAAAPRRAGDGVKATISAASTAVSRPLAHNDKTVTSMVPASVRVRREAAAGPPKVPAAAAARKATADFGFGLAPVMAAARPAAPQPATAAARTSGGSDIDKKYEDFLAEMNSLGAFVG